MVLSLLPNTIFAANLAKSSSENTNIGNNFSILPAGEIFLKVGESLELELANLPVGSTEADVTWEYSDEYLSMSGNTITANAPGVINITAKITLENEIIASDSRDVIIYALAGVCGAEGDGSNVSWKIDPDSNTLTISGNGPMQDYISTYSISGGIEYNSAPWYPYCRFTKGNNLTGEELTVIITDGVTSIGDYAFSTEFDTINATKVELPDSITRLGKHTGIKYLSSLPENVEVLDDEALYGTTFLNNSVYIPESVRSVGSYALYSTTWPDTPNLDAAFFYGNAPKSFGENAFCGSDAFTIYYIVGTSGWTDSDAYDAAAGTWNGYKLEPWSGASGVAAIKGFYPGNKAQIERLEQSMIRIGFDREVLSGQVRNNYADLDFSKTPLAIYRASDDRLIYQVKENNGDGISLDVTSYSSSPTEVNIRITNAESLFTPGESYYVTIGAGFIRFTDGTTSPEIKKNDWTFKIKSMNKLIGYSFLNSSDPKSSTAGFSSNTKYMITGDYLNALKNSLGPIEETIACIMRQNKWEGHCYGMAAVFALQKTNNIDLAFFQEDVEELFELDFPKNNWTVFNLLTYYHLLQKNDLDRFNYNLQGQTDNAENVIETMKEEEKFVIIEITTLLGRHAVVGLGISKINDIYEIPIWDPNYFETDIMYVDTKNKNYWLESEHYPIFKVLAATTVDMLNECNLEQQLKDMGHTSMAQLMSISTDFQEDGPIPLYLITNYENFTVKAGGRVANIVDGEKISGDLEFPSGIYLNEMYSSNNELLFCMDLSQIDNFTIENKSGGKPSLTQILYEYDQPTGVAYLVETDGDCKFNFNIDGTLNAAFSNSQSNYITAIRNTTYNRWNNVILSMADGNITVDNTPDNIQLSSSSNTTINVSLGDSFNSTEMGEVAVTQAGLTIQSGNKNEEIVDNSSGKILSKEMLNHSIFFNSLGGTLLDPITNIAYNTVVLPPENPERENYEFGGWYLSPGFEAGTEWDFSNPITHDLELYAKWISIEDSEGNNGSNSSIGSNGESYYRVSIADTSNGIITVTPKSATRGNRIAITITPDSGYKLETLRVVDNRGKQIQLNNENDQYTFIMPAADVTVEATFLPVKESSTVDSFLDIDSTAWYYDAVKYVVENGLMSGTDTYTFEPNTTLSRGMIAQMLYALEGKPNVSAAGYFNDVPVNAWFAKAAAWAQSKGIITGYDNGNFGSNDPLTREQLALILYNYAKTKGYGTSAAGKLSQFVDGSSTSVWAQEGMTWAVGAGLLSGRDGNMLCPTGTATRAEVAQIMMNFCENVKE